MNFEDLNPEQEAAIAISLDAPADRTLAEFLEETATELTLTKICDHHFSVRTDDQGGEMTGRLVYEGGTWNMYWDGWEF